ncbi:NaeI family type II restriction endonuclease [Streptomyces roseicoloratus]|uniref:NaeI family type II restriction endonuclease n=1 Tax=Streptomyces roseicoloratus TaxID=2508722 RepID=A0ABY9RY00_9ACTN|nr:NaeI family type II restriction endonuclease [Streptomyces roseicoloratus]WMX46847.1 NaeI family type II restriction endonuclease [Streptomyces roseicoloratus]
MGFVSRLTLLQPGTVCENPTLPSHVLESAESDSRMQVVSKWIQDLPVADLYTDSIRNSIDYVLDGARTGRFDLLSTEVHPGERASVGAKLEYEVLRSFALPKTKPLDTHIEGIPVDIKATVGSNWAIPTEAHCQICLCTQIQLKNNRHRTWLVRAHTSWLYRGKGNKDGKRGLAAEARDRWSIPLYDWTPLPVNPLRYLSEKAAAQIFAKQPGQARRLLMMFRELQGHIIPRNAILTVGSGNDDPMRRARQAKAMAEKEGLLVLCGDWRESRDIAAARGLTLRAGEWIALKDENQAGQQP